MTTREQVIEAIYEGKLFDFIGTHGHEVSKNDLCDLVKELAFVLKMTIEGLDNPFSQLVDELKTDWDMHGNEEPFTLNDLLNADRVVYIERKEED